MSTCSQPNHLNVIGVLTPILTSLNLALLQLPEEYEHRRFLCGAKITSEILTTTISVLTMFITFLFRSFLILYSEYGLVHRGSPNLKLFKQLYWLLWIILVLWLIILYPIVSAAKDEFPENSARGVLCLLSNTRNKITHYKGAYGGIAFFFIIFVWTLCLSRKVTLFLLSLAPRNNMSSFGKYRRNILTMAQTRGERLLQTSTLIGQEIQLSSSGPIRARELYLISNQNTSL